MSRSAERSGTLAVVAAVLAMTLLSAAAPAGAQEPDGGGAGEAPIHDLRLPIHDLQLPIHDLTLSIGSLDGSFTDSENAEERVVTLAADVLFEFDRADLGPQAQATLAEAADVLRQAASGKRVQVDGYTDSRGDDAYNQRLSTDRARAVEAALTGLVQGDAMTFAVAGHGAADPVAPNEIDGADNPDGRAKNRRVEIRFPH